MSAANAEVHLRSLHLPTVLVTILVVIGVVCASGQPILVVVAGLIGLAVAVRYSYGGWSLMDLCYLAMAGACLRSMFITRWEFQAVGNLLFVGLMGLAILGWLVAALRGKIPRPFHGNGLFVTVLVTFFVGWTALSHCTSIDPARSIRGVVVLPLVMLWGHWVVPVVVRQKKDAERVLRFFVYAAAFLVVFTTLTGIVPVEVKGWRLGWWGLKDWEAPIAEDISINPLAIEAMAAGRSLPVGIFGHPNSLASLLMLCVGPTLYFLFSTRLRRSRLLLILLLAGIALYLIASTSRGGLGAAIVVSLVFAYLYSRRTFIYTMLVVLLMVVVVFSVVYTVAYKQGIVFSGHQIVTKSLRADPTSTRLDLWRGVAHHIKQRPWVGWGLNAAVALRENNLLLPSVSSAHNVYLRLAEETGLPSALWMLVYMVMGATAAWRIYATQPSRRLLGAAFLAIFVGAFCHQMVEATTVPSRFGPNGAGLVFLVGAVLSLAALPPEVESEASATAQSAAGTG